MDNTAWYAWDDMTPWRFAILIGVVLVTWAVIKLVERFGASDERTEFDAAEPLVEPIEDYACDIRHHGLPGNVYHAD